ncbi:mu-type opioid receptor-like isoform X1 [Dreissena polymorpha]|uniref:G-protein coupled receptors family 1 profile domain-containing protein n=2 Tax=Dreissena polymorpha TaxID=45954 RepID=A0A9D3YHQ7_DREPO|nr:mu-type opioid receptor-like isoform X1 [Dreissena polymorpha]KAH3698314.1 hypothetical protein DPMN_085833 [Dreissena polymorpha]
MDPKSDLHKMDKMVGYDDEIGFSEDYDYAYNYNYTYDVSDSMKHLPLVEFLPTVIIYGIVGLMGLVGNLLVLFAIARVKRMRTITNMFLFSLASADLLLVCLCIPVRCVAFYSYTWNLGEFMCRGTHYVQHVSMICSAMTLTTMSIERFIAIRFPLRARSLCTKRHARVVISVTWVTSFVAAVPIIFVIKHHPVGQSFEHFWCVKWFPDMPLLGRAFELYMLAIMLILPCLVMVITYTWIANIIWHVATRRADMRSGSCISENLEKSSVANGTSNGVQMTPTTDRTSRATPVVPLTSPLAVCPSTKAYVDDDRTRKQVVMMLMVVVVLFAVCWTPLLVNNLLTAFDVIDHLHVGALKPLRIAFHILAYANSCVNPFVYAFMSKNFRDGFKQSVLACLRGSEYLMRSKSRYLTSTTRASTSNSADVVRQVTHRTDSLAMRRSSDLL